MTGNPASARSRERIKKALLEVLDGKPFDRIFVAEVCRAARISRGTFYTHYRTLNDVVDDMLSDIRSVTKHMPSQLCIYRWGYCPDGVPLCRFLRSRREYLPLITDPVLRERLIDRILEWNGDGMVSGIDGHTDLTEAQIRGFFAFQLSGCLNVTLRYIDSTDEEWTEIQTAVDSVLRDGLEKMVYRFRPPEATPEAGCFRGSP